MRWVRFIPRAVEGAEPRLGVVDGDAIRGGLTGSLEDLLADGGLVAAGRRLAGRPDEVVPLDQVRLLAPVAAPRRSATSWPSSARGGHG